MLKAVALAAAGILVAQNALADTVLLSDRQGRWLCLPDDPAWPQILIDFEEDAYRRCDQNTCVSYLIGKIEKSDDKTRLSFSAKAQIELPDAGGPYREVTAFAGAPMLTRGQCAFHGLSDLYDPERRTP
ncbi:MAG: hypothetical protein JJ899_00830 [Alphaproteobacteria bacterium]|nr:hypothetical protein [Alphaproteobacteria bacterium]